jgi:hypothetical protein
MFALLTLALAQEGPEAPAIEAVAPAPAALNTPAPAALRPSAPQVPQVPQVPVLTRHEGTATVPFRLAVVPGLGIGASPTASVDGFSTGVLAHGVNLKGFDTQLAGSWLTGDLDGVQTTLAYAVADDVRGAQITLGVNAAAGSVEGGQFSLGVNVAGGDMEGAQVNLGINVAAGRMEGAQVGLGVNLAAGDAKGVQATTGLNVAKNIDGLQLGSLNIAEGVKGSQIGWMNVGQDVNGLQLGLVNVAKTSDVSIAPINLIGDGLHRVDVWASESAVASVAAKIGSKNFYTLGGVGWVGVDQPWWTFGAGFGAHLQKDRVWVEIDASTWAIAKGVQFVPGLHNKLRTQVGFEVAEAFQPFAGVSLNHWYGIGRVWPEAHELPSHVTPDKRMVMWPGAHVGVSF